MRAYLQLLRLPNVFTAMADVAMGYLLTHSSFAPWPRFAQLLAASSALYLAGMVLNDVCDIERDTIERPHRPIPSGRVSRLFAARLSWLLFTVGLLAAGMATYFAADPRPIVVAILLAALVVIYDVWLKATLLAPLGMGGCRLLNVLLGMSTASVAWGASHWVVAIGIGIYIAGVTWFARTEADVSHRVELALSTLVMVAGLATIASFPRWRPEQTMSGYFSFDRWYPFWIMLAALLGLRCVRAIIDPRPAMVQMVVKTCILSLIVIDAAVVYAASGPYLAVAVLALLAPAIFLGRWIYST
jgi:hypothetical protein